MARPQFNFGGKQFPRIRVPAVLLAALFCLGLIGIAALFWTVKSWVNVKDGEIAVFVKKTGEDPEPGTIIAKSEEFKGVQKLILSEGWHFMNYYVWERIDDPEYRQKITVPDGKTRTRVRLGGTDLDTINGEVIAYDEKQKGITPENQLLKPGTYAVNRLEYWVSEPEDPVRISSGFTGIVVNKAAKIQENPNVFVVDSDGRGVLKKTLSPMTRFVNRFEQDIYPIDLRSQIYQLGGEPQPNRKNEMIGKPISFPSKDGFTITLEGKIEWKIDPDRAAEVFVKYADSRPVMNCIVEKIILPQARSYVRIYGSMEEARNFIEGATRQSFQEKLLLDMKKNCMNQGIIIVNVSITEMLPPKDIAALINEREVAKRLKAKYLKEKDREIQEKQLAMSKKLQERSRKVKDEEAKMSVMKTMAQQEKQVAIVEAQKKLSVAKLELEASKKLANAIISKGQAKADVIGYNNIAVSAGIRKAAEAFQSGESYARYVFLQKIAPGFMYILANTDGPFIKIFNELFGKGAEK